MKRKKTMLLLAAILMFTGCGEVKAGAENETTKQEIPAQEETTEETVKSTEPQWVAEPIYDKVGYFQEGLCPVKKEGLWGYIDETGEEVIPFQYTETCRSFTGGHALADGGNLIIDREGNEILKGHFEATEVLFLDNGEIYAYRDDQGWHLDSDGNLLEMSRDEVYKIMYGTYDDMDAGLANQKYNEEHKPQFTWNPDAEWIADMEAEGKMLLAPGAFW